MERTTNGFRINNPKRYPIMNSMGNTFDSYALRKSFDYAFRISDEDLTRPTRSGGSYSRNPNQVFVNHFLGKLSEYALYSFLQYNDIKVEKPDINIYNRGIWDTEDLIIQGNKTEIKLTIKSTKSFGNLMLLETKDWDSEAIYLPSNAIYDYFCFVRIDCSLESILKRNKKWYSSSLESYTILQEYAFEAVRKNISFDFPGWLPREKVKEAIRLNHIIKKNDILNDKTKMDATNYYIQSGDFYSIENFIHELKKL